MITSSRMRYPKRFAPYRTGSSEAKFPTGAITTQFIRQIVVRFSLRGRCDSETPTRDNPPPIKEDPKKGLRPQACLYRPEHHPLAARRCGGYYSPLAPHWGPLRQWVAYTDAATPAPIPSAQLAGPTESPIERLCATAVSPPRQNHLRRQTARGTELLYIVDSAVDFPPPKLGGHLDSRRQQFRTRRLSPRLLTRGHRSVLDR